MIDPFDVPGAWRVGEAAWTTRRLVVAGHDPVEVRARGRAADAMISVDGGPSFPTRTAWSGSRVTHTQDWATRTYSVATDGDGVHWIARDGQTWAVREHAALEVAGETAVGDGGPVLSPMPGTITLVEVEEGQQVVMGQRLVVVEAMKMEHVLIAPTDGVVRRLTALAGSSVAKDIVLLTIEPMESSEVGR